MTETAMTAPAHQGAAVPAHWVRERSVVPARPVAPGTALPPRTAAPADRHLGTLRLIG